MISEFHNSFLNNITPSTILENLIMMLAMIQIDTSQGNVISSDILPQPYKFLPGQIGGYIKVIGIYINT